LGRDQGSGWWDHWGSQWAQRGAEKAEEIWLRRWPPEEAEANRLPERKQRQWGPHMGKEHRHGGRGVEAKMAPVGADANGSPEGAEAMQLR